MTLMARVSRNGRVEREHKTNISRKDINFCLYAYKSMASGKIIPLSALNVCTVL